MIRNVLIAVVVVFAAISANAQTAQTIDTSSQVGKCSLNDNNWTLPASPVSDAEVAEYKASYDSIQKSLLVRKATAPNANCALPALRSIISNNEPLVLSIAYGKEPAYKVIKQMYLAEIKANYEKTEHQPTSMEIANVQ